MTLTFASTVLASAFQGNPVPGHTPAWGAASDAATNKDATTIN